MSSIVVKMKNECYGIRQFNRVIFWVVLAIPMFGGCHTNSHYEGVRSERTEEQVFDLEHISSEQCIAFLSQLNIDYVSPIPEANAVFINGFPEQMRRTKFVLELVDVHEDYVIENLGPISKVRALPSNAQIAEALGNIRIGTFDEPPMSDKQARGIIDIQGDAILAILPVQYREQLLSLLKRTTSGAKPIYSAPVFDEPRESVPVEEVFVASVGNEPNQPKTGLSEQEVVSLKAPIVETPGERDINKEHRPLILDAAKSRSSVSNDKAFSTNSETQEEITSASQSTVEDDSTSVPKSFRIILKPFAYKTENTETTISRAVEFQNGEDILDMTLPETITLIQLLDLVGEYIDLDYVYDPVTIGNQSVALKLRGALQGEMKVKNLYTLLETVLKFKGLAMIRREEKLVAIVPIDKALDADPQIVNIPGKAIQAGDIVVTRVFELQYVDVANVTTLLQNMKLGVVVTPLEEAQLLIVTCYAHSMDRIEQLVNMINCPGRTRECRLRRLQYVTASPLAEKIRTLAQELRGISITSASKPAKPSPQPVKILSASLSSIESNATESKVRRPVYLDADERTNRILMIGYEEELSLIEELVDVLDVAQEDLRTPKVYDIKHIKAQEVLDKLNKLEVLGGSAASTRPGVGVPSTSLTTDGIMGNNALAEKPLVAVLEATNQLLVKATREQHAQVREFLDYIDVSPEDLRTLEVYRIRHMDADIIKTKLEQLNLIGADSANSLRITAANTTKEPAKPETTSPDTHSTATVLIEKPQVVVNESTNSLLINATSKQHSRITKVINYLDNKISEEEIPYKIYPLENSSPKHLASLLEKLILEKASDREDKIEKVAKKKEKITIVPDPNTFSLIVYASRNNQEWIENLIESLDKRRPQVLIDVILVEITRTDTFEYDLNLVANAKEAVVDNIIIDPIHAINSKTLLEGGYNLLDNDGNPTGQIKAFYSDKKVQALLTAIKRKNYGRVLAKPKILVDDGQQGEISTTEETTYVKEAIQVPDTGTSITTRDFVPIQASILLQITPHISEGELLRLDVHLSRGDFGARPLQGAPPDKTTSEVTTTVFVPDNHTVILGGLVKLNQSKGGSKVPILGDIPLVGGLFRSVDNSDIERKLYVFLKANVVRPYEQARLEDLRKISEEHRKAFEESEAEFQKHEDFPGVKPEPMQPERVLEDL